MGAIRSFLLAAVVAGLGAAAPAGQAQTLSPRCGADAHRAHLERQHPEQLARSREHWQQMSAGRAATPAGRTAATSTVYVVPVVFHVVHAGGIENISRAQIEDGLRELNADFRRRNADTAATRLAFRPVAADTRLEFRLARLDPDGNCTDGIVRAYATEGTQADLKEDNVQSVTAWPTDRYLNIWVVRRVYDSNLPQNTQDFLGYAKFPGEGDGAKFGAVVRHDQVGTIGTAADNVYRTLTHEVGHCFNLRHTFEGGCFGGDGVADTPPAQAATYQCNLTQNTCRNDAPDQLDQIENFMSYDECQNMFTEGQRTVITQTLTREDLPLFSLWQEANRQAIGTQDGYVATLCPARVDFHAPGYPRRQICANTAVQFSEYIYNTDPSRVLSWSWSFPGGVPATAVQRVPPPVRYDVPGTYAVGLTVVTPEGTATLTRPDWVQVRPAAALLAANYREDFEQASFPDRTDQPEASWTVDSPAQFSWRWDGTVGQAGTASAAIRNQALVSGTVSDLLAPAVDVSGVSGPVRISFQWAYARRSFGNRDQLEVWVSSDCGQMWERLWSKTGFELSTIGTQIESTTFVPTADQWRADTLVLSPWLSQTTNLSLRFRMISRAGNLLYLDEVSVGGGLLSTAGPEDDAFQAGIYPNPVAAGGPVTLAITLDRPTHLRLTISDVTGRPCYTMRQHQPAGAQRLPLPLPALAPGIYLVQLQTDTGARVLRLVVN